MMWRYREKTAICSLEMRERPGTAPPLTASEGTNPANTSLSDFHPPELWDNEFSVVDRFLLLPSLLYFVTATLGNQHSVQGRKPISQLLAAMFYGNSREETKNKAVNNDKNAQLARMTYIRVRFPENTSESLLQLPGSYKLLTHLSRKHNSTLLWGICIHGIYQSFRGLIICSLFSKVNICKLHKSDLVLQQYFSSRKQQHVSPSSSTLSPPLPLPRTSTHRHKDARPRNLGFVYIS